MNKRLGGWVCALGLMLPGAVAATPAETEKVLSCMRANIPQTLRIQSFELNSVDRAGTSRVLKGKLYGSREDDKLRAMLKIEGPADLRGAAYLLREGLKGADEMYVYLPALNKVRRVVGSNTDSPLFGTDFSYNDIKQISHAFSGGEVTLEGAGELPGGRKTHILTMKPDAAAQSRYALIRAWVDEKTCVILQAEFMEGASARKRFSADAAKLKQAGKHWYLEEANMEDLRDKTRTRLKITGVKSDTDLASRYFSPSAFYVGN